MLIRKWNAVGKKRLDWGKKKEARMRGRWRLWRRRRRIGRLEELVPKWFHRAGKSPRVQPESSRVLKDSSLRQGFQ